MRVLVACEFSGTVRDEFLRLGHDAWSCDLLPTESVGPHFQGDVTLLLDGWVPVLMTQEVCDMCDEMYCNMHQDHASECFCYGPTQDGIEYRMVGDTLCGRPEDKPHWDLLIAHPPCTYLCSSGLHWNKRTPGREQKTEEALEFVRLLLNAPVEKIALENPIGRIGTAIRPADQIIQPFMFADDAIKQTALWLKNLPKLVPTVMVEPRIVNGKKRWGNQTDSGQNRLGPSDDRWKLRSKTYHGIAIAMAEQWGGSCYE